MTSQLSLVVHNSDPASSRRLLALALAARVAAVRSRCATAEETALRRADAIACDSFATAPKIAPRDQKTACI
jgi:hypothetical protein